MLSRLLRKAKKILGFGRLAIAAFAHVLRRAEHHIHHRRDELKYSFKSGWLMRTARPNLCDFSF